MLLAMFYTHSVTFFIFIFLLICAGLFVCGVRLSTFPHNSILANCKHYGHFAFEYSLNVLKQVVSFKKFPNKMFQKKFHE